MKSRNLSSFTLVFCLLLFLNCDIKNNGKKCEAYKVIIENGRVIDSVLFKKTILNGNKKIIFEEVYSDGQAIEFKKYFKYNKENLESIETIMEDGQSEKLIYIYDMKGRQIREEYFDNGVQSRIIMHDYPSEDTQIILTYEIIDKVQVLRAKEINIRNEFGQLSSEIVLDKNGDTTFLANYTYDPHGNVLYKSMDHSGNIFESYTAILNKDNLVSDKIFYRDSIVYRKEEFKYNGNKKIQGKWIKDAQGRLIYEELYEYYSNGFKKQFIKVNHNSGSKEVSEYEEKEGLLTKEEFWQDNKNIIKHYYNYFEQ